MDFGLLIQQAVMTAFGLSIAVGAFAFIYFRDATRWRRLAGVYGQSWMPPLKKKHMRSLVLYGDGIAFNGYKGIVTIGIHETGIALKVMPPFGFFTPPLFIPFRDIRGWNQFWYLDAKSIELEIRAAPDIKIVMPASQVKWIEEASGRDLDLRDKCPPHKQRPSFSHAAVLVQGIMGLTVLVLVLASNSAAVKRIVNDVLSEKWELPEDFGF